jgi:predicted nucleic acid-binding protein
MSFEKPKLFLDTSAFFAGLYSNTGGAHALLQLGEKGDLQLVISSDVVRELDVVMRRKLPEKLNFLLVALDTTIAHIEPTPASSWIESLLPLVNYQNDAIVLAAALAAQVDFFVTLDRQHFLDNEPLRAALPFPIGTPGDCLAWHRRQT